MSVELGVLQRINEQGPHGLAEVEEKFPRDPTGVFEDDPELRRSRNEPCEMY